MIIVKDIDNYASVNKGFVWMNPFYTNGINLIGRNNPDLKVMFL